MSVGECLRSRREGLGISLRELAAQLRMDFTYLSYIERGERFPSLYLVNNLARFLEIPVDELARMIANDKTSAQMKKLNRNNDIEELANQDRATFLSKVYRDSFEFPRDRERIPWKLYGLKVIEEEMVFRTSASKPGDELIYAGLFPPPHNYRGESNIIVVATKNVRTAQRGEKTSEKTKTFHVLHELGHYRIHWLGRNENDIKVKGSGEPLYCSSGSQSPSEEQANLYASSFLMPRGEVYQMLGGRRSINLHRDGNLLCNHFFVEPYTLKYRLITLGFRIS